MKLKFLIASSLVAISLAACVLQTPSPEPTGAPPTSVVAPTSPPPSAAGSSSTLPPPSAAGPSSTASPDPVKGLVDMGGVLVTQYYKAPPVSIDPTAKYSAVIRTNKGDMEFELFAEQSPVTVNNFIFLANDGFYDNMIFHRVIPNFMIQGGDPTGTGMHGPGYKFQDELAASLIFNEPGKLAMANSGPNTNGSQFFVTTVPTPHLNGLHTIFGRLTQGQQVADTISMVDTIAASRPQEPIVILGINITLNP
ncbi:MAG: peptidylprolyl isomerase [Chloroflexota bacterium]|nr:peptidylprolyl isomerase [Chloroflexota bacterium]